jgi:hypothetical protein
MKLLLEHFGLILFAFVVFVDGLIALPRVTSMPATPLPEVVGLTLAFLVVAGGFTWYYYMAGSHQGTPEGPSSTASRRQS